MEEVKKNKGVTSKIVEERKKKTWVQAGQF